MKNTPPHKLLLIRFFSQGLLSAAIVILIVGIILTRLEQKNYLRHATISAQERIERIASHIGHQIEDVSLSRGIDPAEVDGQTPMHILVIQEAKNSGLRKLQVLDENGVVLGSSASQEIGINLISSEITHVQTTGEITGHYIENDGDPYLHFAAPVEAHGKKIRGCDRRVSF